MVNLASTLNEKVEVLCEPLLVKSLNRLLHQQGGCFNPRGPRKVPVAIVSDQLVQCAARLTLTFLKTGIIDTHAPLIP